MTSAKKTLYKSLSWRAVSIAATYLLAKAFGLTEETTLGFILAEVFIFTALFYVHERIWNYYDKT